MDMELVDFKLLFFFLLVGLPASLLLGSLVIYKMSNRRSQWKKIVSTSLLGTGVLFILVALWALVGITAMGYLNAPTVIQSVYLSSNAIATLIELVAGIVLGTIYYYMIYLNPSNNNGDSAPVIFVFMFVGVVIASVLGIILMEIVWPLLWAFLSVLLM